MRPSCIWCKALMQSFIANRLTQAVYEYAEGMQWYVSLKPQQHNLRPFVHHAAEHSLNYPHSHLQVYIQV